MRRTMYPSAFPSACVSIAALLVSLVLVQPGRGEKREFRPVANAEEAVQRIEELGGAVRYLTAKGERLEVDFQFAGEQLGDEHLKYVRALENVITLRLKRTAITDKAMAHVRKIETLRRLYLEETAISDRGLADLASLPELEFLNVYGTAVTNEGIRRLGSLPRLKYLFIGGTPVTEAGVAALLKVAPQIKVVPDRAEDRRRAEIFLQAARKLLTDAEQQLVEAERDFKQFDPQKDALKKEEEKARKLADGAGRSVEELRKQRDDATKRAEEAQCQADETAKRAKDKPDDEQLQLAAEEKQKALVEARMRADEANAAFDESQKQADAARVTADRTKVLFERAKKVAEIHEAAKKVLKGARLRLEYAQRDLRPAD